jgi:hypothetical protein
VGIFSRGVEIVCRSFLLERKMPGYKDLRIADLIDTIKLTRVSWLKRDLMRMYDQALRANDIIYGDAVIKAMKNTFSDNDPTWIHTVLAMETIWITRRCLNMVLQIDPERII